MNLAFGRLNTRRIYALVVLKVRSDEVVNDKGLKAAVLGFPIAHSLSPVLHAKAFDLLGIAGSYEAIEVASGALDEFLHNQGANYDYLSLTMPLKEEVLAIAETSGISVDDLALRIQSVNTLVRNDSRWFATSTDGSGFVKALANSGYDHFSSVLILGAGGTARAVAGALDEIADHVAIMGRSERRNVGMAACFQKLEPDFISWDNQIELRDFDLIVNTTPSGAADLVAENIPSKVEGLLFDVLYMPWPTLMARRWSDGGGKVISGLELLLYQGIDQINIVYPLGQKIIDSELRLALNNAAK
jgi:shikimate dehydrogenase